MNRGLTQEQAASLLGVEVGADPETVRRAWRAWARLAHPDHGGDREFFERLRTARDVLLDTPELVTPELDTPEHGAHVTTGPAPRPGSAQPPRLTWAQVLRRPSPVHAIALVVSALTSVALVSLVGAVGPTPEPLALALAATPAAIAAAGWAWWAVSLLLGPGADAGHRITALTIAWTPLAIAQVVVAELVGASVVPVLPMLVLPFVAVIAAVNPGAGLWRRPSARG